METNKAVELACENYPEWEQTIRNLFSYLDTVVPGYTVEGIYGRPLEFDISLPDETPDRIVDEVYDFIEDVENMCLM